LLKGLARIKIHLDALSMGPEKNGWGSDFLTVSCNTTTSQF
jgi:hypothetical protein